MKKLLIIILSFWCIVNLKAQQEFAPIGAKWYFNKIEDWNPPDEGYITFICEKDTTINNLSSKIIHKMYYTSKGDTIDWGSDYLHQSGDTIFYLVDGVFKVLYNFTLSKGDTMQFYSNQFNPCIENPNGSVVIDSISSQTIANLELKELHCSPTEESAWQYFKILERIGNLSGFYPEYVNTCGIMDDLPSIGNLRCYSDNEIGIYKMGTKSCDTLIIHKTNVEPIVDDGIKLFPNESTDYITFKVNHSFYQKTVIEIYNLQGKHEMTDTFYTPEFIIDISGLSQGVHCIHILQNDSRSLIKKIIKL